MCFPFVTRENSDTCQPLCESVCLVKNNNNKILQMTQPQKSYSACQLAQMVNKRDGEPGLERKQDLRESESWNQLRRPEE